MRVTVLLFAAHREAAGAHVHVAELPDGATVSDAFARVRARVPALAAAGGQAVAFALNQEHVASDALVRDGDEVAVLPPVAGG